MLSAVPYEQSSAWPPEKKDEQCVAKSLFNHLYIYSHVMLSSLRWRAVAPQASRQRGFCGDTGKGSVMHVALFIFAVVIAALLWNHFSSKKVVADAEALKNSAEKAVVADAENVEQTVKNDVTKVEKAL